MIQRLLLQNSKIFYLLTGPLIIGVGAVAGLGDGFGAGDEPIAVISPLI
jgi:hypothetical protein